MNIHASVTGIATAAQQRAETRIQQALTKREAELAVQPVRSSTAADTIAGQPSSGGK